MPLITNIAYSPDPAAGQAVGLDVAVDGATQLVVDWGDGSPLQSYTIDPGSRIVHLSHGYDGPVTGTIAIRAKAPDLPDERSTLALQVAAEPYTRISDDPEPGYARTGPVISADGDLAAWAESDRGYGAGVAVTDLTDGTIHRFWGGHGEAYQLVGDPVMLANGAAVYFTEEYYGIEGYHFHPVTLYRVATGDEFELEDAYEVTVTDDAKYVVYEHIPSDGLTPGDWILRDLDAGTVIGLGSDPEYDGPRYHVHFVNGQLVVDDDETGQHSVSGPLATDTTADGGTTVVSTAEPLEPGDTNGASDVYLRDNDAPPPPTQGADGPDVILLGAADDVVDGGAGKDYLAGAAGSDSLSGGAGDDLLDGGAGADALIGGDGIDTASYATSGARVLVDLANPAENVRDAAGDSYQGIENLLGGAYNDTLRGDAAANALRGGAGNDRLEGRDGDDRLVGGDGIDTMLGGAGDDRIYGGAGETILGGDGNDTLVIDGAPLKLNGGLGTDTVVVTGQVALPVTVAGVEAYRVTSGAAADFSALDTGVTAVSQSMADGAAITGTAFADTLRAGAGGDRLQGGAGGDALFAGAGDDTFVFRTDFGRDVVRDFDAGDVIAFSRPVFTSFAEVMAHAGDYGADGTVIAVNDQDKIILLGVDRAALQASDFAFIA